MAEPSMLAWALPQLRQLLPLDDEELKQIILYTTSLPDPAAYTHLTGLLGDSPDAIEFATSFNDYRRELPHIDLPADDAPVEVQKTKTDTQGNGTSTGSVSGSTTYSAPSGAPPSWAPPAGAPPTYSSSRRPQQPHTNQVIRAGALRARDEQEMQQALQALQYQYNIYNSDIEPEHETEYYCTCPIHQYQVRKFNRYEVQRQWSIAVMYPGEKAYDDCKFNGRSQFFSNNPYVWPKVVSPYGYYQSSWGASIPQPGYHAQSVRQTIDLNNLLNRQAQTQIDSREPKHSVWGDAGDALDGAMKGMNISDEKRKSLMPTAETAQPPQLSRFESFKKKLTIKSADERTVSKATKLVGKANELRDAILREEEGRWQDEETRHLVELYQHHMGMFNKIATLRASCPLQYLHLLRAGYFEPIPVAWANQASNPLKFSIEAAAGWRGITPAWRGYEDTAEERLYWVLNHREGSVGMRMKPDQISEMNMARERMARAEPPPPDYYSAADQCHVQHTSTGYSKQVMPSPMRNIDRPETATDDTMILLDVSGSMGFDSMRPVYNQFLITGYQMSSQPKNKDVAKAIVRRFTDAMENHDHQFQGYDLVTFANSAKYVGTINHHNFERMWNGVRIGGGTRVMTGWQRCKELHFQKHSRSATHHPVFGWQAGPETPMLRLLLLLDGEATDMDEFELDLLGLNWAHVTIFLIGPDGCPHHHRHANELQRISDVNHHVSFVDAQGNCPERFVTHELLKRHLGYEISMQEFQQMEELPAYSETPAR